MATEQEKAAIREILAGSQDRVILDLGAYRGEEYEWMGVYTQGPRGSYLAVEPDPRNANVIRGHFALVVLIEAAIADHVGMVDFHMCDNDADQAVGSGSIRVPTGHLQHFPWCKFPFTVRIPCYSLDRITAMLPPVDLIWADLQGAERDMIAGGTEALKRTRYLFLEAEAVEMYEGQALKPELLAMLPDFDVVEEFEYNVLLKNRTIA